MNNDITQKMAEELAKDIIGVEPLNPPESLKQSLRDRYGSCLSDGGELGSTWTE